jgi:hypothetical protein
MQCPQCKKEVADLLFCPHCDKAIFPTEPEMVITLGREHRGSEALKELVLRLEHLTARAEREDDRDRLIFLFKNDLLGFASDGYEEGVYENHVFTEALIRAAKTICRKL